MPNKTVGIVHYLIDERNSSEEPDFVKGALKPLDRLVQDTKNGTSSLEWPRQLSNKTHMSSTNDQLGALFKLFNSTLNGAQIWKVIDRLRQDMGKKSYHLPSLFKVLRGSKNGTATFGSLDPLTSWTSQNSETFQSILDLLHKAGNATSIGDDDLSKMTDKLF